MIYQNNIVTLEQKIKKFKIILKQEINHSLYITDTYNLTQLLELYRKHFNLKDGN